MGNMWTAYVSDPASHPNLLSGPTFDSLYGFANGRKERVMIATQAEMEAARLPLEDRDYCAHLLLKYRGCRADVWPMAYKCHHEKHAYLHCQYEDYVLRMKEFERERRLLRRKNRLTASQGSSEELAE
ncbi:hypothetical protein B566_EDAN015573 [Ephemera danica]|nr:hypothetical protein B566_EDAN015573 [Ephemera danica]